MVMTHRSDSTHIYNSEAGPEMFTHLLIATDGSEVAAKAETIGLSLAKHIGARVTVVTATEPYSSMNMGEPSAFDFPIEDYDKAAAQRAARILGRVGEQASKLQVSCETVRITDFPSEAIVETAKSKSCDLIVVASHGRRGMQALMLGSQAQRVITASPVPVLVCR
jgi:nucleotide-binding universal stress UspA family protein